MDKLCIDYKLDFEGARVLDAALTDGVSGGPGDVAADLSAAAFPASPGLRILLKHAQNLDAFGRRLGIKSCNDTAREVLRVRGFEQIVEVR